MLQSVIESAIRPAERRVGLWTLRMSLLFNQTGVIINSNACIVMKFWRGLLHDVRDSLFCYIYRNAHCKIIPSICNIILMYTKDVMDKFM